MELTVLRVPDALVKRMISEPGIAEQVVGMPEAVDISEEQIATFNYLDLHSLLGGRAALATALDQEGGTQVGDDFGYGPAWVFTASEVAKLAEQLEPESSGAEGDLDRDVAAGVREFAAVFVAAAGAQQGVVLVLS